MHVILDHLSAFIISTVIILIIAVLQIRGMQSSTENTVNHVVRKAALHTADMLQTDIENMRTQTQTESALADGRLTGATAWNCQTIVSGDTTMTFTFPTLADPSAAAAATDPDESDVVQVSYELTRAVGSVTRNVNGGTVTHPLYTLSRMVDGKSTGASHPIVTFFSIELLRKGDGQFEKGASFCPVDLYKVRFQVQVAQQGIDEVLPGQANRGQLNFSRWGSTVDLVNWQ